MWLIQILFGAILGYYLKSLDDKRDQRRKILTPVFEELEKGIVNLKSNFEKDLSNAPKPNDVGLEIIDRKLVLVDEKDNELRLLVENLNSACRKISDNKMNNISHTIIAFIYKSMFTSVTSDKIEIFKDSFDYLYDELIPQLYTRYNELIFFIWTDGFMYDLEKLFKAWYMNISEKLDLGKFVKDS